ncbi:MAG: ABC transporter substrate-binding protein [Limnochordia bacterium]
MRKTVLVWVFAFTLVLSLCVTAAQAQTTLRVFLRSSPANLPIYEELFAEFEKRNPDIQIEYENLNQYTPYLEKYLIMYIGGVAPDVFFPAVHWLPGLVAQGAILPLDSLASQHQFNLNQYIQEVLQMYRVDGRLYGLPNDFAALGIFYNEDKFDEVGLPYPKDDWNWDAFMQTARRLTIDRNGDGKPEQIAATNPPRNPWLWSALGTPLFDDPMKPTQFYLASDKGYEALQFLQDARWQYNVFPQPGQQADFLAGTAAMHMIGHWYVPNLLANAQFSWNVAALPRHTIPVNRSDGSAWCISAGTEHPEEAWRFLEFIGGYEGQVISARKQWLTPTILRVIGSEDWLRVPGHPNMNKSAFLAGQPNLFDLYELRHPDKDEVMAPLNTAMNQVWDNQRSPREAIESVLPQVRQFLDKVAKE